MLITPLMEEARHQTRRHTALLLDIAPVSTRLGLWFGLKRFRVPVLSPPIRAGFTALSRGKVCVRPEDCGSQRTLGDDISRNSFSLSDDAAVAAVHRQRNFLSALWRAG